MPIPRVSVTGDVIGAPIWSEPDKDGDFAYWKDVADLVVSVSSLIARIELAHDLHAVFTIKDLEEFKKVKALISETLKQ